MLKRIMTAVAGIVFLCLSPGANVSAEETYVFQVPMVKGLSMGSMSKSFDGYMSAMSRKMGINVKYQEYLFRKGTKPAADILKMVKDGKVHFTYLYASEYVMMKDEVDKLC